MQKSGTKYQMVSLISACAPSMHPSWVSEPGTQYALMCPEFSTKPDCAPRVFFSLANLEKPGLECKGVCQSVFNDNCCNRYSGAPYIRASHKSKTVIFMFFRVREMFNLVFDIDTPPVLSELLPAALPYASSMYQTHIQKQT